MARLTRIGVGFSARLQATLMAFIGLIAGFTYAFGGAAYELFTGSLNSGTALAFLALIGMPVLFAAFGFVAGGVGAVLYNFAARRIRRIHLELDQGMDVGV